MSVWACEILASSVVREAFRDEISKVFVAMLLVFVAMSVTNDAATLVVTPDLTTGMLSVAAIVPEGNAEILVPIRTPYRECCRSQPAARPRSPAGWPGCPPGRGRKTGTCASCGSARIGA